MRHQLANLPEIAEAAALEVARRDLDNQARDARIVVDDLIAEQEKIDADVDAVRARRERDRDRMDRGLISNPKDLERMTHEMASLERRISSLEDDELEVMERVEEAQTASDSLASRIAATDIRLADLAAARAEKTREIEAELTSLTDRRGPLAADLPGDLVALYDRLFAAETPGERTGDVMDDLNPDSLKVIRAFLEPSLKEAKAEERFQFERHGYFVVDAGNWITRTVTLRDSWTGK